MEIFRSKRNWTPVDYCYFNMERSLKEVDNMEGTVNGKSVFVLGF